MSQLTANFNTSVTIVSPLSGGTWYDIGAGQVWDTPDIITELVGFNNSTWRSNLTSLVNIPNSVTSIGTSAFRQCSSFSSIIIPSSVTSIGTSAFRQCSSLSSITIPSSVTSIGLLAFSECNSLSSVTFDSPSSVSSIGNYAFANCSSLSSITIPSSVTTIGVGTFYNCNSLVSITFDSPSSVSSIGNYAFGSCSSLSSITIPNSVSTIGNYAFDSCASLSALYIPSSVASIGTFAFNNIANPATLYTSPLDNTNPVIVYFQSGIDDGSITPVLYPEPPPPPLVCFNAGSKILTDKGYVAIETLRKGDNVKTLMNGYVAIDMIGYREIENVICKERIKDKLYVCKESEYPELFEELVITGSHAILVDEFKEGEREKTIELLEKICITDNKYRLPACVDSRASAYEKEGKFTIYHLALENDVYYTNYGIYANGLLVETCSKRYLKELSNMTLL